MDLIWRILVALSAALPCFLMGFQLARVWKDPRSVDEGRWVSRGVGIMVIELILVTSGVAFSKVAGSEGGPGRKLLELGGLGFLYLLFAVGAAVAFRSPRMLASFGALVGGRALSIVLGLSREQASFLMLQSVFGAVLCMILVFVTTYIPLPRLGLTAAYVRGRVEGGGLWAEQPHRAIAAATFYFFLLGAADLLILPWIDPPRWARIR